MLFEFSCRLTRMKSPSVRGGSWMKGCEHMFAGPILPVRHLGVPDGWQLDS